MKKYEISIWNDVYDSSLNRYKEEKIAIIGSDSMTSQNRALEPQLKQNVNGINTLTFYMYYDYIDNYSGEKVKNPFISFLVNERKIKVFWENGKNDGWYDLVVKSVVEDTAKHTFTYTCEDMYLTELSRTGFELEFQTELQNNIGTAKDLVEATLKNTDWQYLEGDTIYQETEEAVYEVLVLSDFIAIKNPDDQEVNITSDFPALIYYSCAPDIENLATKCQFYYNGTNIWQQDQNDMLVINGNCYTVEVTWDVDEENQIATAFIDETEIFAINFAVGLSKRFRAKRFVQSQKTIYNRIVDRYVNVYNYNGGYENLLGYYTTEYNDALAVVNLVSNASNFSNLSGWTGEDLTFRISPGFNQDTDLLNYTAKGYLKLAVGYTYNNGIQSNRSYIKDGFIIGEKYIFRIKAKEDGDEPAETNYIRVNQVPSRTTIKPIISSRNLDYEPTGISYFSVADPIQDGDWIEYDLECIKSVPYDEILSTANPFGIFIYTSSTCWLEEVQFYKEIYGTDSAGEIVRIDPGEMQTQSIVQPVWKYFLAEQDEGTTKDTLEYIQTTLEEWNEAIPVYNNYEKFGTIEISQSNRFNILQTIAETFHCWVRFVIEHTEEGYIKYIDDKACKYVQLLEQIGSDTGISFIYGIDLQSIKRNIKSDAISTKTIVLQNNNEYGKNGFCSIARSQENYPKENFIYNFDYFIRQGLLNADQLNYDLYAPDGLAYYYKLHNWNTQYAENLDLLINKKNELTKQSAMAKVYGQYITSSENELEEVEADIIKLAGVENIEEAFQYIKTHYNNTKVVSLMNDRSVVIDTLQTYRQLLIKINISISILTDVIEAREAEQETIIDNLRELNQQFYTKYSRYIQEGTWNSEDYYDDDLYYLDALQVAYTSSRPQISYDIKVIRLSELEDFSSKVFKLGDICYIQDTDYFGYKSDGITPYKEQVYISEMTNNFDSPDKDIIVVQNYKTQFDDLFQRITAATQNLEFSEGKYAKAANIVNIDGTIKSSVIQGTFDSNKDLVYGAQNESVNMDNTGITVTSNDDGAKQVKVTSGGLFVSNDGGLTWKNAIRGDGITADIITAGKLNVESVTIYGKGSPSFLWDEKGISAFEVINGATNFAKYVRFDKYGIYGIKNRQDYVPESEADIYNNAIFGFTWSKFFMKNENGDKTIEVSTDQDIVVKSDGLTRIKIGRVLDSDDPNYETNYGIRIKNEDDDVIFQCDNDGSEIAGWQLGAEKSGQQILYKYLRSSDENGNIEIRSNGTIGCFAHNAETASETAYAITTSGSFTAKNLRTGGNETIPSGVTIYVFSSYIGQLITTQVIQANYNAYYDSNPSSRPSPSGTVQFMYGQNNYSVNTNWSSGIITTTHVTQQKPYTSGTSTLYTYTTTYKYYFSITASGKFTINYNTGTTIKQKYIPPSTFKWSIDYLGDAIFHNITADGGTIAGWHIDTEKIYRTDNNGNIITQLNSKGTASSEGYDYSIIADAIKSAMAIMGNVQLADGLINGEDINELARAVQYAIDLANSAYGLASSAQNAANNAQSTANDALVTANNAQRAADAAYSHVASHTHGYSYYGYSPSLGYNLTYYGETDSN